MMTTSADPMAARDPHRFVNELDNAAIERLVARLESRAKDAVFSRLFDRYADRLVERPSARVLEVGCGTGAMARALARHADFSGTVVAVDQSPAFIEAARKFAADEGLAGRIEFLVGDAHGLDLPTASFDAVFAHTLISHVTEPLTVLREMARVARPGGVVAICDGDYASLTYACPDHELGQRMDLALASATFNNRLIMRDLPRLLPQVGLRLAQAWGEAVVEIGAGSYFRSFAETYAPAVIQAGLVPAAVVETWLADQRRAMSDGTFFGSCTYYTVLAHPAGRD
jgi:SAM-dependent methyltransferase